MFLSLFSADRFCNSLSSFRRKITTISSLTAESLIFPRHLLCSLLDSAYFTLKNRTQWVILLKFLIIIYIFLLVYENILNVRFFWTSRILPVIFCFSLVLVFLLSSLSLWWFIPLFVSKSKGKFSICRNQMNLDFCGLKKLPISRNNRFLSK